MSDGDLMTFNALNWARQDRCLACNHRDIDDWHVEVWLRPYNYYHNLFKDFKQSFIIT